MGWMRRVARLPAVSWRPRRFGVPVRGQANVADPSRGTIVALVFPSLALGLGIWWLGRAEASGAPLWLVLALLAAPAAAERIAIQIGPRSWYTACTPVIILAGLLGGPLVGLAAGFASQTARTEAVWRRRFAEGGIGALQGFTAGAVGLGGWGGTNEATLVAAAAGLTALAINTAGRAFVMLERRTRPFWSIWGRGIAIDVLEAAIATPLLAVLLVVSTSSPALVVGVNLSVLLILSIAHRLRQDTVSELETEQANARRDQLTGAPNRRAFEEALVAEHSRIVRGGLPAGLYVIDLDRFKSINDQFGHGVGDEVLTAIVGRLRDGLRPSDVVARWGGEEITVLAPGLRARHSLEEFGERIRSLVSDEPLVTSTSPLRVTASVGGTLLDGSTTPGEAMRRADGALYEAKLTRDASSVALPPRPSLRLESA